MCQFIKAPFHCVKDRQFVIRLQISKWHDFKNELFRAVLLGISRESSDLNGKNDEWEFAKIAKEFSNKGIFMITDIEALEVFASLCETGSVQKTATFLNMENSAVSRKLSKLEQEVGRSLFDRTKRPFMMTEDARIILSGVRKILEEKQSIEAYYRKQRNNEEMEIRMMFGNGHIDFAPRFIQEYSAKFPKLVFNMISPPDVKDFLAGRADIICLSGQAHLSDCINIPRGRMVFIPVASPDYIARHGEVMHPSELVNHRVYHNLYKQRYSFTSNYVLTKKGVTSSISAIDTIRFSNVEMTHRAVIDGGGIAPCMPIFLCIDDLESGRLVPVLNGWHRPSHLNYVACKKDDWKIKQIRTFATWWAKKLTEHERECEARLVKLYGRSFLLNLLH